MERNSNVFPVDYLALYLIGFVNGRVHPESAEVLTAVKTILRSGAFHRVFLRMIENGWIYFSGDFFKFTDLGRSKYAKMTTAPNTYFKYHSLKELSADDLVWFYFASSKEICNRVEKYDDFARFLGKCSYENSEKFVNTVKDTNAAIEESNLVYTTELGMQEQL